MARGILEVNDKLSSPYRVEEGERKCGEFYLFQSTTVARKIAAILPTIRSDHAKGGKNRMETRCGEINEATGRKKGKARRD